MQKHNSKVKSFVRGFDFEKPEWGNTPEGFPIVDRKGLTKEEGHLLEAIEMAWFVSQTNSFYVKRIFNTALDGVTLSAVLMGIVMVGYYVNVEYNLGLTFLTEFFA
jgi:hypothetical protein